MKKRYIVICLFLLLMVYLYINRNIYYISKWGMYIKIENVNDTTIVNISKTRWHWEDNYIKYQPQSAEMTNLDLNPIKDTLYVIEHYMKIIETHVKDYNVKEVGRGDRNIDPSLGSSACPHDPCNLKLDDEWNIEKLPHRGRHPNAYHAWVLEQMRIIDMTPRMNQELFIEQFNLRVKLPVQQNPNMLRKNYWTN